MQWLKSPLPFPSPHNCLDHLSPTALTLPLPPPRRPLQVERKQPRDVDGLVRLAVDLAKLDLTLSDFLPVSHIARRHGAQIVSAAISATLRHV